jgi:tetratricopeptide (TPR) repeat protein
MKLHPVLVAALCWVLMGTGWTDETVSADFVYRFATGQDADTDSSVITFLSASHRGRYDPNQTSPDLWVHLQSTAGDSLWQGRANRLETIFQALPVASRGILAFDVGGTPLYPDQVLFSVRPSSEPSGVRLVFPEDDLTDWFREPDAPLRPRTANIAAVELSTEHSFFPALTTLVFSRAAQLPKQSLQVEIGSALSRFDTSDVALVTTLALEQHRLALQHRSTNPAVIRTYHRVQALTPTSEPAHAWATWNLAHYHHDLGTRDSSFVWLDTARQLFQNQGDRLALGICYVTEATWLQGMSGYDKAVSRAVNWLEPLVNAATLAAVRERLPVTTVAASSMDTAPAAGTDDRIANPYQAMQELYRQGLDLKRAGHLHTALEIFTDYLNQSRMLHSEPAQSRAHFQLGTLHFFAARYQKALDQFGRAADLMEMLGDTCGLSLVDNNIGAIYHQSGDLFQARLRYESALRLSERCREDQTLQCHFNLGDLYTEQENWRQAQDHYDQALGLAQDLDRTQRESQLWYAKGLAHLKEGLLSLAYEELETAIRLSDGSLLGSKADEEAFLRKIHGLVSGTEPQRTEPVSDLDHLFQ